MYISYNLLLVCPITYLPVLSKCIPFLWFGLPFLNDDQTFWNSSGLKKGMTHVDVQTYWGPRFKNKANGVLRILGDLEFYLVLPVYIDFYVGRPFFSDTRETRNEQKFKNNKTKNWLLWLLLQYRAHQRSDRQWQRVLWAKLILG